MVCILLLLGCNLNNTDHYPEWDELNEPPENILQMSLDVPQFITSENSVLFKMEIKNVSGKDLELGVLNNPFSDSIKNTGVFDFIISDSDGSLYWSKFYNKALHDLPAIVTLNKDESLVLELEWDRKDIYNKIIKPGRYNITGYYSISVISDQLNGINIHENEAGFYTTHPQEIFIQ